VGVRIVPKQDPRLRIGALPDGTEAVFPAGVPALEITRSDESRWSQTELLEGVDVLRAEQLLAATFVCPLQSNR